MIHAWKTSSVGEVIKYNKALLLICGILSVVCLLLAFSNSSQEEKWVIIPSNDINNKYEISNRALYPSYLKEWGGYIARELFTISPRDVENKHAEIRKLSLPNKELSAFFAKELEFVVQNRSSSVFFVKKVIPTEGAVLVTGTLHYWFAGSSKKIAVEKSYKISYQQMARGLVLLSNVEEYKSNEVNK